MGGGGGRASSDADEIQRKLGEKVILRRRKMEETRTKVSSVA